MFQYHCLNPIAGVGLANFNENYQQSESLEGADAVLVRSAAMHGMELPKSLLAVARAGAGVNNIPLADCAEQGIVVFNTPGANANGVKELVLAGMLLASRDIAGGIEWVKSDKEDGDIAKTAEKQKKKFAGCEISGKKLGIIGLGAIDTMIEYGHAVSDAEFQEREHAVKGSDLATIVYTSGSTGTPKGIELTHSNFVFITYSGISSMHDIAMKPNRRLLLFLPLAHVFARAEDGKADADAGYGLETELAEPDGALVEAAMNAAAASRAKAS